MLFFTRPLGTYLVVTHVPTNLVPITTILVPVSTILVPWSSLAIVTYLKTGKYPSPVMKVAICLYFQWSTVTMQCEEAWMITQSSYNLSTQQSTGQCETVTDHLES